jgi:hypothetical protein
MDARWAVRFRLAESFCKIGHKVASPTAWEPRDRRKKQLQFNAFHSLQAKTLQLWKNGSSRDPAGRTVWATASRANPA